MKIFIGSSTKKKSTAKGIADALEEAGFQVLRWWDEVVFRRNDYTMPRLIEISKICDAAVMVFGADDKIYVERKERSLVEMTAPRDNVVLEYGLFAGQTGIDRTLIVADPNIKIPSDLSGITIPRSRTFKEEIVNRMKDVLGTPQRQSPNITFHTERSIVELLGQGGDPNWVSRGLYLGSEGANLWKDVEKDPRYTGTREFAQVKKVIKEIIDDNKLPRFDCIVSFGPGVATLDKGVVPYLRGESILSYIPIDINPHLAFAAAIAVDKVSSNIQIPFCIVGDFEEGMNGITKLLHSHTSPGRAFLMLGGTFGNLEVLEDNFLQGLKACMQEGDIAIIDVFTAIPGYSMDTDPLLPFSKQPESVKRYLSNAIAKKRGIALEKVVIAIDDYIEGSAGAPIQIAGSQGFAVSCKKTRRPIVYVRRYDFEEFAKHLSSLTFNIIDKREILPDSGNVGRAIYVFKR
jgi:uncharacterized SAM-dependent methyltransferase